ncbi:MAG: alpha/beta hydrolase [Erysipelotrichaceae bacterium]
MFKKILKGLLVFILALLIIPYFIPFDTNNSIPTKPYENSVFFTTSDGVVLHTQQWVAQGDYKGKILLIHGLGASTFTYRNNALALSEAGYDVIAVDLPAFGYSSKKSGLNHSQVQRAIYLWQLLDDYDANHSNQGPWHLVGHSMGASTVLAMANQVPTAVRSMTLIDGAVTSNNASMPWIFDTPVGQWLKVAMRYYVLNPSQFKSFLKSAYNQEPTKAEVTGYLTPLKTKGTISALIDFVKTADNVLITELVPKNIPLFLLWGDQDTWVPKSDMDLIKAAVTVTDSHIFPNAGHCSHEVASDFNQVLLAMLAKS